MRLRLGEIFGEKSDPLSESRIKAIVGRNGYQSKVEEILDRRLPNLQAEAVKLTAHALTKYADFMREGY